MQADQAVRAVGPSFTAERRELLTSMDGEQLALYLVVLQEWSRHLGDLEERVLAADSAAKKLRAGLNVQISEVEAALRPPEPHERPEPHESHERPEPHERPESHEPPEPPEPEEPYVLSSLAADDLERLVRDIEAHGERRVVLRPPMTVTILHRYLPHLIAVQPDGDSAFTTQVLAYHCERPVHVDSLSRRGYHLVDLLALLRPGRTTDDVLYAALTHHLTTLSTVRHEEMREHVLARARWRRSEPVDERALFRQLQAVGPNKKHELEEDFLRVTAEVTAEFPALSPAVDRLVRHLRGGTPAPESSSRNRPPLPRSARDVPAAGSDGTLSPRLTVFARHLGNGEYHRLPEIRRFSTSLGLSLVDSVHTINQWASSVLALHDEVTENPVIEVDEVADEVWVDLRLKDLVAASGPRDPSVERSPV